MEGRPRLPSTRTTRSATSKKAAKEAAVAAGLAAVGTVLEELRPGEKNQGGRATKAHDEEAR